MRLITHNLLRCNVRGLKADEGYPLKIEAEKTEVIATPYRPGIVHSSSLIGQTLKNNSSFIRL